MTLLSPYGGVPAWLRLVPALDLFLTYLTAHDELRIKQVRRQGESEQ